MKKIYLLFVLFTLSLGYYTSLVNAQTLEPVDLTWSQLQTEFNNASAYPRLVSILSVNCVPCQLHRNDIRDKVMNQCDNPDLRWLIVWFEDPGHPSNRQDAITQAALINDSRVTQWWYTEHQNFKPKNDSVAYLYGDANWVGCPYAWDMSKIYNAGTMWTDHLPPDPVYCMAKVFNCCNSYSINNYKAAVDIAGICDAPPNGISNPDGISGINLFPNPSSGTLNLEYHLHQKGEINIFIYDTKGALILAETVDGVIGHHVKVLDLSDTGNGLYQIQFNLGSEQITKTVLINNQ